MLSHSYAIKKAKQTMNANMNVPEQCSIASSKGNHVIGMIRRNMTYKEKRLIIPLYKAIIRTHLEYCTACMESIFQERHRYVRKPVGAMGDNIFRTLRFYFIWRPPNNYMASAK